MAIFARRISLCTLLCMLVTLPVGQTATDPANVAALKAFRTRIQDPMGRLQNWEGDDPCGDQWEGVFCSPPILGISRVNELRLLNHNLTGPLAPELGNLDSLQIIDLMWNQITGSIPKELGNLKQLKLMLFNGNNLTGSIPEELGNLALLDRFQIDENQISGSIPKNFQNLISVKHLHMNNNSLSGSIPKELGSLPKLLHLLLDTNNLDGTLPSQLGNLSTLRILQLDNNGFTNSNIPEEFSNMANLTKLSMRNCNLQGRIPDLSHLLNLEYLDLSSNKLEGEIPSTPLPQNLTTIDLSTNLLNGSIPERFGSLPNLQFLALRNNNLSGPIPISFGTGAYFTSSAGEILLDFRNNSLTSISTNLTNAVKSRPNLSVWLHGNKELCKNWNDDTIRRLCKVHHDFFFPESMEEDNHYGPTCDPLTCTTGEEPIPAVFYTQGLCRCAMPIILGYRLKSPSFSFFTPNIRGYEQWIAKGISVSPDQVYVDSFVKEPGPRFATVLKIFPQAAGARIFNESEVLRIFALFSGWKLPANDFYGPQELLFFNYTLYQSDLNSLGLNKQNWRVIIAILTSCVLSTTAIVAVVVCLVMNNRSRTRSIRPTKSLGKSENSQRLLKVTGILKAFTFEELAIATKSFSKAMEVGQGGYGTVYRGVLGDGQVVAIKRAKEGSRQGAEEFYTEIELLSRVHHRNLVCLLGYCVEEDEQMLVYEYMANGTLKDCLSGQHPYTHVSLDFATRLRIAIGAARGVQYLHTEANPPIFHRDIKASNILLDAKNNAKVADFGLSKLAPTPETEGSTLGHVSTLVKGTPGYLDPEYFLTHKLTDKSDVYSFGVVLMELLTGMQPIANGKNIVREVKRAYDTGTLLNVVDCRMGAYPVEVLEPLARLAVACCRDDTRERPSMTDVVRDLDTIRQSVPWSDSAIMSDADSESLPSLKGYPSRSEGSSQKPSGSLKKNCYVSFDEETSDIFSQNLETNVDPR